MLHSLHSHLQNFPINNKKDFSIKTFVFDCVDYVIPYQSQKYFKNYRKNHGLLILLLTPALLEFSHKMKTQPETMAERKGEQQ